MINVPACLNGTTVGNLRYSMRWQVIALLDGLKLSLAISLWQQQQTVTVLCGTST